MTNKIEFLKSGEWVMRITADRRIEVNEGITVTEAAQKVLEALQTLLEQPEQEPVALIRDGVLRWHIPHEHYSRPAWTAHGTHMLYASPPQRQPLTTEERGSIVNEALRGHASTRDAIDWAIRHVERHHGIGEKP